MELNKDKKAGWISYTPEYGGNNSLPETEQFSVKIRAMTHGQRMKYAEMLKTEDKFGNTNAVKVARRVFLENVSEIKNLTFDGEAITTAERLFEVAPSDLIREITDQINAFGSLSSDEAKN